MKTSQRKAAWSAGDVGSSDLSFAATTSGNFVQTAIPVGTGIGVLNAAAARNMRVITDVIEDKLVANQWHLGFLGDLATVWKDYTGKGVSFGVYDSGVDTRLAAFKGNYDASNEVRVDGTLYRGDYRPSSGPHGTAVAGLIAARADGKDTIGVSFDAKLTSVNVFDPYSGGGLKPGIFINAPDPTKFYKAMAAGNRFDVTNHSWGTSDFSHDLDNNRLYEGTGAYNLVQALTFTAETGRGGLGTIAVKAAGNSGNNTGNPYLDRIDVSADSQATDRHWVLVSAYREVDGNASSYSNRGPALFISGPSNDYADFGGTGIWTTDVKGRDGYNLSDDPGGARDFTDSFGGTSAATPIVSGAIGLMLDANSGLGWRDVKDILAASAKMPVAFDTKPTSLLVGSATNSTLQNLNEDVFKLTGKGAAAVVNGGGHHFSTDYGYGAVDAYGATRMAEVWNLFGEAKTSANEEHVQASAKFNKLLADARYDADYKTILTPSTFKVVVNGDIDIEHIDLTLSYTEKNTFGATNNDFLVTLISPDGVKYVTSTMATGETAFEAGTTLREVLGFAGFRGETSKGTWTIQIADLVNGEQSIVKGISLDIYGAKASVDNVYHYTSEFAAMAAIKGEGARAVVTDTNGGVDWLDFSASGSPVSLDMNAGGAIRFAGRSVATIGATTMVENAVMGDGFDIVVGNAADNHLLGMRGSDSIDGGAGNDFIVGGEGYDDLTGGAGRDVFYLDTKQRVDQDRIMDFSSDDFLALTERFDKNGVLSFENSNGNAVLRFDNVQFGERVTLNGLGAAKLYLVAQKNDVFYYAMSAKAKLDNAIALGDGPLDAVPGYAVNTHTKPTVDAATYVPTPAASVGLSTMSVMMQDAVYDAFPHDQPYFGHHTGQWASDYHML